MILEILLGLGASALAVANSKDANENARIANSLNTETTSIINPAINQLNASSNRLSNTLRITSSLKERALVGFTESFVYYLQHINSNVTKKAAFDKDITELQKAINNYQVNINQLASHNLDQNTMLVSTAAGGLVTGVGALGMGSLGASMTLGLGLSFFGVGSFLMSAYQVSKTQDALNEAKYLNANKYSIKSEIENKVKIVDTINILFTNFNNMLVDLIEKFEHDLSKVQEIYRRGIVLSKKNMKRIAKGRQPVFEFENFDETDQCTLYLASEKCKLLADFARSQLLTSNGDINYYEVKKIGIKYE